MSLIPISSSLYDDDDDISPPHLYFCSISWASLFCLWYGYHIFLHQGLDNIWMNCSTLMYSGNSHDFVEGVLPSGFWSSVFAYDLWAEQGGVTSSQKPPWTWCFGRGRRGTGRCAVFTRAGLSKAILLIVFSSPAWSCPRPLHPITEVKEVDGQIREIKSRCILDKSPVYRRAT